MINESSAPFAPLIYYFHPLLAGPRGSWAEQFRRVRGMGFDHVLTAPLFAPGSHGDIFLTRDHERLNPAIGDTATADTAFADLVRVAKQHALSVLADIVIGRVADDADLAQTHPHWFHIGDAADLRIDPRTPLRQAASSYLRFDHAGVAAEITGWWTARLLRLAETGIAGFRCVEPHLVPAAAWRQIINGVQQRFPNCHFLAWTPGIAWNALVGLRDVGFTAAFSSLPWWDGRSSWFLEEHELLRGIGAIVSCAEAPFGPRLAHRPHDGGNLPLTYRRQLRLAAALGNGIMIPMGFEFASDEDLDPRVTSGPLQIASNGKNIDLSSEIGEANALCGRLASLGTGELRALTEPEQHVTALLRTPAYHGRQAQEPIIVLASTDTHRAHPLPISLDPLPASAGAPLVAKEIIASDREAHAPLEGGEVRILRVQRTPPANWRNARVNPKALAGAARVVVDNVTPGISAGKFATKHVIGDTINVEADAFTDGHDVLVVDLIWRALQDQEWQRLPMQPLGNDRWSAQFAPDLELKRAAGADVDAEIAEALELLQSVARKTEAGSGSVVCSALQWLNDSPAEARTDILLTPDLREVMREAEDKQFITRPSQTFLLDIERPQAAFGTWYELFPRSATDDPSRHGTFADVIHRLPAIKDMGFDVLYMPPIHPIGVTNRKGRNNALKAAPGDVGSPYAIGSSAGGHTAIHPALGTIDDFRRLRDAAAEHGMELALDFAIQCSPDHPWLREHPEWFAWRPDGSIRFAENPPKKYEDIVNVDFYAKDAVPGLWKALRDVVLHWAEEGVRLFRVDNPHTKPLPFWEWMIAEVRSLHPDVVFLSEAFTRPKVMYQLAKAGFSQSYTYFTWRNSKHELTDYFTELTTAPVKDFFRPHLFVNTPDINPYFLQTSGRPGFLIRAALAATLSGLWGMYSGFEICEAAPLPGREEYLDSEKYEIRVRDYSAPGNIVAEITKLNRIRKLHPALQSHLGLRFYPAHNDQVLFYGKGLPVTGRNSVILIAVSLDPFHAQETTIEIPLWEWRLPDSATVAVQDLMRGNSFIWHGKLQRIRLDPNDLPFAIWRIAPRVED
jgi:starch synthase (maltosyl-transferring)